MRSDARPSAAAPILQRLEPTAKVVSDVVIAVALVILLAPVFLLIALAIKVTSRGPVLFVQNRIGLNEELFPFYKFRTMYDGSHLHRGDVIGDPDAEITERYKSDPRITPVGRVLRRWSLDELPQLLNVAMGHMSLVGPRPILPEEATHLAPEYKVRHTTKPGLTGLWQVSGRKETTWKQRMELDVRYVEECSLAGDFAIMARTAGVVLKGDGAY